MRGPRRRWRFGPRGAEEVAPPPDRPEEAPSFDSARIEREAEAHFTPGPSGPEAPAREARAEEAETPQPACHADVPVPPEESNTGIQ